MGTGSSSIHSRGRGGRGRLDARLRDRRKARLRWLESEALEPRTLLATIPAAAASGGAANLSGLSSVTTGGNANNPAVAIDPYDPQKLFAVWGVDLSSLTNVPHTTAVVDGAYSTNGGASWSPLGASVAPAQLDPATINATPPTAYTQVTSPSLGFDGQGNVYVLSLQTSGAADGELFLTEFNFSGPSPGRQSLPNGGNIYQWVTGSDAATDPVVAVDAAKPPAGTTPDPFANNVYIAWASIDTEPANTNPYTATGFNANRAELVVGTPISNPSGSERSLAFGGVQTLNTSGNFGPQDNSHPQLVINQNAGGQVTVAWDDFGTGATASTPFDNLMSNLVQPGSSFGFTGATGTIAPALSNSSPGNWGTATVYSAGIATSSTATDPVGIAVLASVNGSSTSVDGNTSNDIIVADRATGQIGELLNSGTGTFGATTTYLASGSPSGVVLGDFVGGHTTSTILDAATANGAGAGGVSVLPNGTAPTDGTGKFLTPVPLGAVPGGKGEGAIVVADLDGNGVPDIVAADPANQSIDIWLDPATGAAPPISLALPAGDTPIAVVVDKFRGSGANEDIAVLNANGTIVLFQNGITPGSTVSAASFARQTLGFVLPGTVASMTSGPITGNSSLPDLVVVTNDPGHNELYVVQNSSSGGAPSFASPQAVPNSNFFGTPVVGEQGVATGVLSTTGNYSAYQDIAVVYAAFGGGESTVAVFQNLDSGQFARSVTDFDAGQKNPTAIALSYLSNTAGNPWEDIVVTNNDNFDRDTFAGTVSVLQTAAAKTVTIPITTPFSTSVSVPNPGAVDDLTVTLALTDQQSVQNLQVVLFAPNGNSITLFNNQDNSAGTANTAVGLPSGNAVGVFGYTTGTTGTPGIVVGTTFDDNATRDIFDATTTGTNGNTATDYIGYFRPEGGSLSSFLASLGGKLNGPWTLQITNYSSTAPASGSLKEFSLQFSTGMTASGPHGIASTVVTGALGNNFARGVSSTPNGVGPGLVLAVDNTLGSASPYQGRIYAAYVGYVKTKDPDGHTNPPDNTDIYLAYSTNGGVSWTGLGVVNTDDAPADGYSSAGFTSGRTQFQPTLAVDPATGALVASWRDARDDAANARVATYVTASIDGGQTFNAQTYANPPQAAVDAITGKVDIMGPEADNQSGGDPLADKNFGFGNQMGLAVFDGHVYPVWAGNLNQATVNAAGVITANPLNIWSRPMVIAAGPRILSSTMGPIPLAQAASGSVTINVTFDRPVSASTFVPGDVQVFFRGTASNAPTVPLTVTSVTPTSGLSSQFQVTFNPLPAGANPATHDFTGTYSYLIAPDNGAGLAISSPIETYVGATLRPFDPMDQNADGTPDQNAVTTPFVGKTPGDVYAVPAPQGVTQQFFGAGSILNPQAGFNQNTLPLIVPGPQVVSTSVPGGDAAAGNLITDGTTGSLNVTFDRPMQVSTFTPGQVDQIMGPAGSVSGPQYFPSTNTAPLMIPGATATGPGMLSSSVTIPSYNGTFSIAHITVGLTAAFSPDSDLTAVLIAPDGTMVTLFSGVGGTGSGFTGTVFDDAAENPIASGTAPFTGMFQPSSPLSSLVGHTVDIKNPADTAVWAPGVWTLQISNSATGVTGKLAGWSLSITPVITVTPVNPSGGAATTFQIGFPLQQLSGTYTVQIGPNILDTFNEALDTNQNAGLAVLRGQDQDGPTSTVHYGAGDLPKAIAAAAVPSPGQVTPSLVTSTIDVPDNFIIQGDRTASGASVMQVQLSLTDPIDSGLTATLTHYGPGNVLEGQVTLFSGVGTGQTTANFNNTIFDDNAATPIEQGGAPFFSTFNPQESLATVFAPAPNGLSVQGTWVLTITNDSTGAAGTLTGWSLTFQKPLPTSGLGEPGSDDATASFRIFTLGQSDALSSQEWTAVGPASIGGGATGNSADPSGRVTGLAIDPSDPSGNTVYAAGASGGIWKTNDFLTTSPAGPTWIPLTDFGPTSGVNIGGIAVFPRNNDPNQSIVIAATGEGDTGTPGVGFLISQDGGATWNLADSTDNVDAGGNFLPIASVGRDRAFVGDSSFGVSVDPKPTPSGGVIVYAALSGPNGGIWRSEDTGRTWKKVLAGQATSVALDQESGVVLNPDTNTLVPGNLQVVYAAIRGVGVFMSPNQGQVWNQMLGGIGNPLIFNNQVDPSPNVNAVNGPTPNGAQGRIVLATPAPTGNAAQDDVYAGWLYALVATPAGGLDGIFVTKDYGQNWTQVRIPTEPNHGYESNPAIPANDVGLADFPIIGSARFPQGNYNIAMTVDPTDPNIIYVGGTADGNATGLIRINLATIWDAHALVAGSSDANDGGQLALAAKGPATINDLTFPLPSPTYLDYIRNPSTPFVGNASLYVYNYNQFTNNGSGVEWIPFDVGGTDYHRMATMIDPITGLPRLIFGNDQGVWSVLDNNGSFEFQIGSSDSLPGTSRNGNLQITQFYYGAAQPSNAAALIAGSLFYGSAQDNGGPRSTGNIITSGNMVWNGPGGDASGVATDQQGNGTVYQYFWPCCGGGNTDFFQVNGVGRTYGLLQQSGGQPTPDPQWPYTGGAYFAVNPVNGQDIVISSAYGRIFATTNEGVNWFDIGDPSAFNLPATGAGFSPALAYGAPDPTAPEGVGNLGNFIYVGTANGQIYVTQDGGGNGSSNNWINISAGLDGSTVEQIITDPARGSHDAYAVTLGGVYYIPDSIPSGNNPTPTWINITANIRKLSYAIFGQAYNPTTDPNKSPYVQPVTFFAIAADWRYAIPFNSTVPSQQYRPALYVAANSGVYQSLDNGQTWTLFPDTTYGAIAEGGYLPHVSARTLSLSLGNINSDTGMPTLAGPDAPNAPNRTAAASADPDTLMAATFGQGSFAINLAPLILGDTVTVKGSTPASIPGTPPVVNGPLTFLGSSEITGFGNATWITVEDITDPAHPVVVAGFNPAAPIPAPGPGNSTDALGHFAVTFDPEAFYTTSGVKTIEIFATDNAGSSGNVVTFTFNLNPPTQLQFAATGEPPATAAAGQDFASPSPVIVDVEDTLGGISTAFNGPVALALANNATGTFVGTLVVNAIDGVATFSDLAIDTAGTYILSATSPGLTPGLSTSITITAAAPSLLSWTAEPPGVATEGVAFGAALDLTDQYGNLESGFNGNVSLSLDLGGNPDPNDLGGKTTIAASGGVASFNNIIINAIGDPFTLAAAAAGLTSAPSTAISVVPPVLVPGNHAGVGGSSVSTASITATAGVPFPVTYTAETNLGTVDTVFNGTVVLSILSGPAGATLLGTVTATASSGIATFSGVILDTAGSYVLRATSGNLTPGDTSVTVTAAAAAALYIVQEPPSSVQAGSGFGLEVGAEDAFNNPTALTGSVTIGIGTNPGGSNLGGVTTATASGGVATFSGLTLNKVDPGYTLQVTNGTLTPGTTTAIAVIPGPMTQLVILAAGEPPASVIAGRPFSMTVLAEDAFGNLATGFNGPLSITAPAGVTGTTSVNASGGVTTFSDLVIDAAGTYQLKANNGGPISTTSTSVTVKPDPQPAMLGWAPEPPGQVVHGVGFGATLKVEDQFGNVETAYNGSVTVALDSNPAGATLGGTATVTASAGVAVFSGLTLDRLGGNVTLLATGDGVSSPDSIPITVTPIPPVAMQVTAQPPTAVSVSQAFGLTVTVTDATGGADPDFSGGVTVAIAGTPGSNTLTGTTTINAVGGVATFSGLALSSVGNVKLSVSSGGLAAITTGTISVTAAGATHLVVTSEPPASFVAGTPFAITVQAEDQFGNVATGFTGGLTAALSPGAGGATLLGTTTATAIGGVATFVGLSVGLVGSGYTIQVGGSGLPIATTTAFGVTIAAPSKLAFQSTPASVTAGVPFGLSVAVTDPYGNLETTFTGPVAIGLSSGPAGGVLGGTLAATANAGVALFPGLSVVTAAPGYTIGATSGGLAPATSAPINVLPAAPTRLVLLVPPPSSMPAGTDFGLSIAAVDAYGNRATQFTGGVSVNLAANPTGAALTGGPFSMGANQGVANFGPTLAIDKSGSGYTLMVTAPGLTPVTSGEINILPAPATHLVVQTQPPSSLASGGTFGLVVLAEDAFGNVDPNFAGRVVVGLPSGSGATLGGGTAITAAGGMATFQGLSLSGTGTSVSLQITGTGVTGTTTAPISLSNTGSSGGSGNGGTGNGGSGGSSGPPNGPTGSGSSTTPLVRMSGIQVIKNRKNQVSEIVIGFSGGLTAAEATSLAEYQLTVAGKHGSFTARNAKPIKLLSASYNSSNDSVTLTPTKRFRIHKPVQLVVKGTSPSGLQDSSGRLIDGNHDGQPGGNAVVVLTSSGMTISSAVSVGPAAIDQLSVAGDLAALARRRRP